MCVWNVNLWVPILLWVLGYRIGINGNSDID